MTAEITGSHCKAHYRWFRAKRCSGILCKNGPSCSSEGLAEDFVCLAADPGLCNRTELDTCIVNVQLYVRQSQSCCWSKNVAASHFEGLAAGARLLSFLTEFKGRRIKRSSTHTHTDSLTLHRGKIFGVVWFVIMTLNLNI